MNTNTVGRGDHGRPTYHEKYDNVARDYGVVNDNVVTYL